MSENDNEEKVVRCSACGLEIQEHALCYEIKYGTLINGRFQPQERFMLVHAACLKD